jgi:hypothetical protein
LFESLRVSIETMQSLRDNAVVVIIGVVVLVGTLVWTVITSLGDSHRAEVEFKTDLVAQIVKPASDALITGGRIQDRTLPNELGLSAYGKRRLEYAEFLRARQVWTEAQYEIGGKLTAAFPQQLVNEWNTFSDAVLNYLKLSTRQAQRRSPSPQHARRQAANHLTTYLQHLHSRFSINPGPGPEGFDLAYINARRWLGVKLRNLTSDLNGADAQQFNVCIVVCL